MFYKITYEPVEQCVAKSERLTYIPVWRSLFYYKSVEDFLRMNEITREENPEAKDRFLIRTAKLNLASKSLPINPEDFASERLTQYQVRPA